MTSHRAIDESLINLAVAEAISHPSGKRFDNWCLEAALNQLHLAGAWTDPYHQIKVAWNGTKRSWEQGARWTLGKGGSGLGGREPGVELPFALGSTTRWVGPRRNVLAVAGGASWICNTEADRWPQVHQLLDLYHASQHLWNVGQVLYPRDEGARREWVEAQLHRLRHGQEAAMLRELAALPRRRGEVGKAIRREQNYFADQAGRMN